MRTAPLKLSLRTRLTLWYCLIFCMSVSSLELAVYLGLNTVVKNMIGRELIIRQRGVQDFLFDHLNRLPMPVTIASLETHLALQPSLILLEGGDGQMLYCGVELQAFCRSPLPPGGTIANATQRFRIVRTFLPVGGRRYIFVIATDLRFKDELMRRFRMLFLLSAPVALALAAAGGYWISARAFRPIREIISAARSINDQNLGRRLRVAATGDEIQVLSETLNDMLERVERSFRQVQELTANASHELRTPVAIMRTAAELALLHMRPTVENQQQALRQILSETEKTTTLLEALLYLARTESNAAPQRLVPVNVAESLKKAIHACQPLASSRSVELRLHLSTPSATIRANVADLDRLWLLLLDNAIKYSHPGGCVSVTLHPPREGSVACEVVDDGIGIPAKDLPYIFRRFHRGSNAHAQSESGAGLGLALVQWIVDRHRARIEAESEMGTGSKFRIVFPMAAPEPADSLLLPLF